MWPISSRLKKKTVNIICNDISTGFQTSKCMVPHSVSNYFSMCYRKENVQQHHECAEIDNNKKKILKRIKIGIWKKSWSCETAHGHLCTYVHLYKAGRKFYCCFFSLRMQFTWFAIHIGWIIKSIALNCRDPEIAVIDQSINQSIHQSIHFPFVHINQFPTSNLIYLFCLVSPIETQRQREGRFESQTFAMPTVYTYATHEFRLQWQPKRGTLVHDMSWNHIY